MNCGKGGWLIENKNFTISVKRSRALLGSNPVRDSRKWVALNNAPGGGGDS
jgi:hypothetical protein